jgi:hypothetical protein
MGLDPKTKSIAGRVFSINVLSLYLCRRGVGLVLAIELCVRAARFALTPDGNFSFLAQKSAIAGSLSVVEIALGITAAFLALGYHRRIVLVMTWALLVLRFLPDYGQTSYGFKILQSVFFWTLFLPSTERRLSKGDWAQTNAFSLASIGALVQIACIYLSAGITKSSDCWWASGDALYRTIEHSWGHAEPFRTLLEQEGLLRLMSRMVFAAEVLAPVLMLSPVKTELLRTIAVGFFMSMHLGIAVLMRIGVFAYLCLVIWLLFLPAGFWSWMRRIKKDTDLPTASATNLPMFRRMGATDLLLGLALAYILTTNLAQWTGASAYTNLRKIGYTIGLDQQWIMFNNPCRFPNDES